MRVNMKFDQRKISRGNKFENDKTTVKGGNDGEYKFAVS